VRDHFGDEKRFELLHSFLKFVFFFGAYQLRYPFICVHSLAKCNGGSLLMGAAFGENPICISGITKTRRVF